MRLSRFLFGLSALGFISSFAHNLPANAQQRSQRGRPDFTASLFDQATCVSSGTYTSSKTLKAKTESLSFKYRIYKGDHYLNVREGHSARLTCQVNSERYAILRLQMGMPDSHISRNPSITINVIQDGNVIETQRNVPAGELVTVPLKLNRTDLARPRDVAIDVQCHQVTSVAWCDMWFVEATLLAEGTVDTSVVRASSNYAPSNVMRDNQDINYFESDAPAAPAYDRPKKKKSLFEHLDDFDRSINRFNNTLRNIKLF